MSRARSTWRLALAAGALAAAVWALAPPRAAEGFVLLGFELGLDQRDFRVFDNFADATANDNAAAHPNFPGYTGAVLACWKGVVEWGSERRVDGDGDPHQPGDIGSGDANFDSSFQGEALGVGNPDDNVMSAISGCTGSTIAFAESPGPSGWRIRFCEEELWDDGPGSDIGERRDLQGVACHEYGHVIGLDHATFAQSTMFPTANGDAVVDRSIASDDSLGLVAIYGPRGDDKPHVSSTVHVSGVVTIRGARFLPAGNDVWFTQSTAGGNGDPVRVVDVPSTDGGTRIVVPLPANAGPGDVLVCTTGVDGESLSNAHPFDPSVPPGAPPQITSLTPPSMELVVVDGPTQLVIGGSNLGAVTELSLDGVLVDPGDYTIDSPAQITLSLDSLPHLGTVPVRVDDVHGASIAQLVVTPNSPPVVEVASSAPGFLTSQSGADVRIGSEPGDVYILGVSPHLVPSTMPGFLTADIGNGFASLVVLTLALVPAEGVADLHYSFSGISGTVHWQAVVFDVSAGTIPLLSTNVQTTHVLF